MSDRVHSVVGTDLNLALILATHSFNLDLQVVEQFSFHTVKAQVFDEVHVAQQWLAVLVAVESDRAHVFQIQILQDQLLKVLDAGLLSRIYLPTELVLLIELRRGLLLLFGVLFVGLRLAGVGLVELVEDGRNFEFLFVRYFFGAFLFGAVALQVAIRVERIFATVGSLFGFQLCGLCLFYLGHIG